jgi:hypothetical protein
MIKTIVTGGADMRFDVRLLYLLLCVPASLLAQNTETAEPVQSLISPCTLDGGPARDFDFWIGHWQVHHPDSDQILGQNRISRREDGCLLLEEWTGASGGTGTSMNFHDSEQGQWRQVWQSAQILIELAGNLDDEGRMVMEGYVHYHVRALRHPFRGRWTPNDDGSVLQEFWEQRDGSDWTPWFSGIYRPIDSG